MHELHRTHSETAGNYPPIISSAPSELVASDVRRLPLEQMVVRSGRYRGFVAAAQQLPRLLWEIGRLREASFRAVGEGTGAEIDLDRFDQHYLHLFLWNDDAQEVVGAYRLGLTDQILPRFGSEGLYTSTLFSYQPTLLHYLTPGVELGRSFVRVEYQKTYTALLLLWKGIARFIARNPQYRLLFGAVSISNVYQTRSRQLLMEFLRAQAFLPALAEWVASKRPPDTGFLRDGDRDLYSSESGLAELETQLFEIEGGRRGIPILLKQYLKLGGRLLGFNQDEQFSNVIDGLVLVDLLRTDRRTLSYFMGADEMAAFLARHEAASPEPFDQRPNQSFAS